MKAAASLILVVVVLVSPVASFSVCTNRAIPTNLLRNHRMFGTRVVAVSSSQSDYNQNEQTDQDESEEQGLVLDNLDNQMQGLASKYPTSESAFLEASRRRAELAKLGMLESQNAGASDEDWQRAAADDDEGDDAAWEASASEAGNSDSQLLIFDDASSNDEDGNDDGEDPKLLLL